MPNDEFMLDVTGDGKVKQSDKSVKAADDVDGLEQEIDDFFDFVVIDKEMLQNQGGGKGKKPKDKAA